MTVLASPSRRDRPRVREELAHQLDDSRVYDRDLSGLAAVLERVLSAYRRRAESFLYPYG